jgi:hypothetical protein
MKAKQTVERKTTSMKSVPAKSMPAKAEPARSSRPATATAKASTAATTAAKPKEKPAVPARGASVGAQHAVDPQLRLEKIRIAAYFRAESRGFEQDHALEDWLAAEAEFDRRFH